MTAGTMTGSLDNMDRRSILGIAGIAAMLPPEVLAQSQSSGNAPSENAAPIGPEP